MGEKEGKEQRLAETSEKLVLAETTLTSRGVTAIQRQESQLEASAKYRFVQNLVEYPTSLVVALAQAICLRGHP